MEMNVPKMDYKLFVRLNRVKDKYKRHFNEEQVIYRRNMTACVIKRYLSMHDQEQKTSRTFY